MKKGLDKGSCPAGPGLWLQALQVLWQGIFLDVLLDVPACEVGLQVLFHHKVQRSLGEVLGNTAPAVGVRDLSVLQVHNPLAHVLVQQDSPVVTACMGTEVER